MRLLNFTIQGFFTTFAIATVSAITLSDADVKAQTTPSNEATSCNNATIRGRYGSKFFGTGGAEVAEVGLFELNGEGNLQGTDTLSVNGTIITRTFLGTYSVKQDCTVQLTFRDNLGGIITLSGTIVDSGKEIFAVQTNPGTVVVGTLKKVN